MASTMLLTSLAFGQIFHLDDLQRLQSSFGYDRPLANRAAKELRVAERAFLGSLLLGLAHADLAHAGLSTMGTRRRWTPARSRFGAVRLSDGESGARRSSPAYMVKTVAVRVQRAMAASVKENRLACDCSVGDRRQS